MNFPSFQKRGKGGGSLRLKEQTNLQRGIHQREGRYVSGGGIRLEEEALKLRPGSVFENDSLRRAYNREIGEII